MTESNLQILGIQMRNDTLEHVLSDLSHRITTKTRTRIFYVNSDCLNIAYKNDAYRQNLNRADLVFPDGSGIKMAAQMTGQNLIENLNGTDMFPSLCELAQAQKFSLFFLGGKPGVTDDLVKNCLQRWPDIIIAGHKHGFFQKSEESDLIDLINLTGADILFVALGAPAQEAWIMQHSEHLNTSLCLGVGGLFDFYSGRIPRAPLWMRRIGIEWTWRLLQEPGRLWKRYILGNPLFVWRVFRHGKSAPSQ